MSGPFAPPEAPDDVRRALEGHGYLADDGLATAIFLAMVLRRPLFLEGEPGGGKTEVANALSRVEVLPQTRLLDAARQAGGSKTSVP